MKNNFLVLESKMVRYKDLLTVKCRDNNEPFIIIDRKIIDNGYRSTMGDMKKISGNRIFVRLAVYKKLIEAQKLLTKYQPKWRLFVTYGYRTMEIQEKRFNILLKKTQKNIFRNSADLYEEIHRFIAVPTVAGHPTGGAVDLLIKDTTGMFIDFGSPIYDYSTKNCYVFCNKISRQAKTNRIFLRKIMLKMGFAPFDGEFWHFSYGDREWAYYYQRRYAVYKQKSLKEINFSSVVFYDK